MKAVVKGRPIKVSQTLMRKGGAAPTPPNTCRLSRGRFGGSLPQTVAVVFGVCAGDLFELPVEIGEIVVAALKADL